MPRYNISGIDVEFPFEAYPYMERVMESLQNKSNALLESPTGTGKTLCLLCATLAWRNSLVLASMQSQGPSHKLPTIVYTSRTHSQIQQVIRELKRTAYRPKMVVLGSREHLCVHPDVSKKRGKAQTTACRFLCQRHTNEHCNHYLRVTDYVKNNPDLGNQPIDIEDMVKIGKPHGPCPYYVSQELLKSVDIVFAPYEYIIDPGNIKSLPIEWENSVLIFDEAHNLESVCSDVTSFDLPLSILDACIAEAQSCISKSSDSKNVAFLTANLSKLKKKIIDFHLNSKDLGLTRPGTYIYELLKEIGVRDEKVLLNTIEDAMKLLEEDAINSQTPKVCRLESIADILRKMYKESGTSHARYYRVHIQEVTGKPSNSSEVKTSRIFSWWCFNSGVAMEEFAKLRVGSIILTSGTLSPMDSFAEELRLNFPVRLENPHVISDDQLWAGIVCVGPSGQALNSSYKTPFSQKYQQDLGNSIVNFARVVPDGLLVFFQSYNLLNLCIDSWQKKNETSTASRTIWERICEYKLPVVEPRHSSELPRAIEEYKTNLRDTSKNGAVFFAECGVEVSEGLDFADRAGRAVIFAGIPFDPLNNPKIRLKCEFLDQQPRYQHTGTKVLTGGEWCSQQASRAVNQAVGCVIRHRHDHGAIIFCDQRFALPNQRSQIPPWLKPHIKLYQGFGDAYYALTRFFRDATKQSTANCRQVKRSKLA